MKHAHHILVVDDAKNVRDLLRAILMDQGYQVTTRSEGFEAIRSLAAAPCDLVLLDYRLPGGYNGIETCRLIRQNKRTADLPVIMVTAIGDREVVMEAMRVGATDFIVKPFDPETVIEKVARALGDAASIGPPSGEVPEGSGEEGIPSPET